MTHQAISPVKTHELQTRDLMQQALTSHRLVALDSLANRESQTRDDQRQVSGADKSILKVNLTVKRSSLVNTSLVRHWVRESLER